MDTWLVTGGAGFIGVNFVRAALAKTSARIVVYDRLTYAGHRESLADLEGSPRFAFVHADVAEPVDVEAAYRAHAPIAVVHFAAESHVDRSIEGPREFVRTNVIGTQEMLEGARAHVTRLSEADRARFRFVQVSTDEVYGSLGATGRFTEETPYAPNSPYAASKAAADHLARAWHETYGLADGRHELLEQLRPLPVPREADPADVPERARRPPAAGLRRRPAGARLALRRGPRRRDPRGARARHAGPEVQLRRRRRADEPRPRARAVRRARPAPSRPRRTPRSPRRACARTATS